MKTFEDRFVAFVDILGFRDLVRRMGREPALFVTVRDVLKKINEQARQFREYRVSSKRSRQELLKRGRIPLGPVSYLQMTAFSDCYVVSEKFPAWHVLAATQALGSRLLEESILSRGAVVRGPAYHSGQVLFGPAVIHAYELESQVAKYPRILVTEEVRQAAWGYHEGICKGRLFARDLDGCWFVNVLAPPLSKWKALSDAEAHRDARQFLKRVRINIQRGLKGAVGDLGQHSKWSWLANQFNTVARENALKPIKGA